MALLKPFAYTQITQGWGPTKRLDEPAGWAMLGRFWYNKPVAAVGGPFVYVAHFHPALDLNGVPIGTAIVASEAGIVTAAGLNPKSPASGIRIQVRIRPGSFYGHGHLLRLAPGIKLGSKVARGQHIADVGSSGSATGPHSHFYVQLVVPGTNQDMLYNPNLFFPYGANANDPRIKPL